MLKQSIVVTVLLSTLIAVHSFSSKGNVISNMQTSAVGKLNMINSRRNFLTEVVAFGAGVSLFPKEVLASGGATAGGAYLLSAKQRYNKRVTAGVQSYQSLSKSLENGNISEAKAFFAGDEEGQWKDFIAAGYLLSNAFRRNSITAPDKLPAVQKWKAFQSEVESGFMKSLMKKKINLDSYTKSLALLEIYLDEVELTNLL